ncbi:MAG: Ig-like domain-containing protein [Candidatus Longimicrobiales bacterium M2_2A_002]
MLASVEVIEGDEQAGSAGAPLDTLIVLRALNENGSAAADVALGLAASGDGSVDASNIRTGPDGRASLTWTLATAPGPNTLEVTPAGKDTAFAVVTASGIADTPASMAMLDGDEQSELAGLALPAPIRVRVTDAFGNPVAGVPVQFSVTGGGTVAPAEATTDVDGVASGTWTLGPVAGEQIVEAVVPDSAVYDIVDLPGSPVTFTATGVSFALDSVTPEPATDGATMTLLGSGFAPDPSGNEVRIDGEVAAILEATQTTLTVNVPSFGCQPARSRALVVRRGADSATTAVTVHPANTLGLAVGERTVVAETDRYCFQLLASAGSEPASYLVGLTATRAWNASASFVITGVDTAAAAMPVELAEAGGTAGSTSGRATVSPEAALREWERDFLATAPRPAILADGTDGVRVIDAPRAAAVGDGATFRVPNIVTDPCNDYVTQQATIVFEGQRLVVAVPEVPSLILSQLLGNATLQAALSEFSQRFQGPIYQRVTEYVGPLDAADDDGRTTVLLTPALNDSAVPLAFSTAVDLVDRATCPASDEEVIVYVTTPDVDYTQLLSALSTLVERMESGRPGVAHELTHVAQNVRRIGAGITTPLPSWLAEGQAELLIEVVGRTLRGDLPGMDHGAAVVSADALATRWYLPRFERLAHFFGWDGGSGRVAGAPEQCSVFGVGGLEAPCDPLASPGAAWALARYISDRVGPGLAGGEAELHRRLAMVPDAEALDQLLETRTGSGLAAVIADWAAALYSDGRLTAGQAPDLQLTSWDLADIFGALPVERQLDPYAYDLGAFTRAGSVVGGGTAYFQLTAAAGHGALAIRVRDALDRPLSPDLGTRLWIVRIQ